MEPAEIKKVFTSNIRKYRNLNKMTQMELAIEADISVGFLCDIESGKKWGTLETMAKLAKALRVKPYQLLVPEDDKNETIDIHEDLTGLSADLIKSGTLKLGNQLNQNGILEVYDEANNLIATLDKDGLRMNALDGGYIKINTTVGFSGYDRNDNRIYWVDGDSFHQKKSVIEEEITLVNKMRILPMTIYDANQQIVNDGIGFVSTL